MAGKCARRRRADEEAVALLRSARRRGTVTLLHGKLHERIKRGERLVMGEMLLRLRGSDERQGEMGRR
jgi:hypothetical protein